MTVVGMRILSDNRRIVEFIEGYYLIRKSVVTRHSLGCVGGVDAFAFTPRPIG
jgi:hypothetical protein